MRRFLRVLLQRQGEALPAITNLSDISGAQFLSVTKLRTGGTPGRRPSGAKLYHRGSRFGEPERRKLDRNMVAKILYLAEALERRTRTKGRHGGVLGGKGLDTLRALLRGFYSHRTGECFPSYAEIAQAAGCCIETVRAKLRALEAAGIVTTVRRKVVASFTSRVHRARFDCAVQTSNSYVFNLPIPDRGQHGDLALPLLAKLAYRQSPITPQPQQSCGSEPDAKFRRETTLGKETTLSPALAAALGAYRRLIN